MMSRMLVWFFNVVSRGGELLRRPGFGPEGGCPIRSLRATSGRRCEPRIVAPAGRAPGQSSTGQSSFVCAPQGSRAKMRLTIGSKCSMGRVR